MGGTRFHAESNFPPFPPSIFSLKIALLHLMQYAFIL